MRIHGGQGTAQPRPFIVAAYDALQETLANPVKFQRFAARVDGNGLSLQKLGEFFAAVKNLIETKVKLLAADAEVAIQGTPAVEAGPYRTDAVGAGINRTAGTVKLSNLRALNAPVSNPHVWDTNRFDWVEYNGAFQQPMARNIISALARGAEIDWDTKDGKPGLRNGVDIVHLDEIETNVGKLHAPKWPEGILGAIDRERAARGKVIYETSRDGESCASCHNPGQNAQGHLMIRMVELPEIGTDPMQAKNWNARMVDMGGKLGLGVIPVTDFAKLATQSVLDRNYSELNTPPARIEEMNGFRPNGWRAPLAYRSRPLEGTWATGPYLHNGSVPSLHELLLPEGQRVKTFQSGSKEMEPQGVGLVTEGEFKFDTAVDGNHNTGHSGAKYGTELSEDQRADLIEYLKTL
jgi:mono/diheme cytochrome c family protein